MQRCFRFKYEFFSTFFFTPCNGTLRLRVANLGMGGTGGGGLDLSPSGTNCMALIMAIVMDGNFIVSVKLKPSSHVLCKYPWQSCEIWTVVRPGQLCFFTKLLVHNMELSMKKIKYNLAFIYIQVKWGKKSWQRRPFKFYRKIIVTYYFNFNFTLVYECSSGKYGTSVHSVGLD